METPTIVVSEERYPLERLDHTMGIITLLVFSIMYYTFTYIPLTDRSLQQSALIVCMSYFITRLNVFLFISSHHSFVFGKIIKGAAFFILWLGFTILITAYLLHTLAPKEWTIFIDFLHNLKHLIPYIWHQKIPFTEVFGILFFTNFRPRLRQNHRPRNRR